MKPVEVDTMPLPDFYKFIAGLEQMIEARKRAIAQMNNR